MLKLLQLKPAKLPPTLARSTIHKTFHTGEIFKHFNLIPVVVNSIKSTTNSNLLKREFSKINGSTPILQKSFKHQFHHNFTTAQPQSNPNNLTNDLIRSLISLLGAAAAVLLLGITDSISGPLFITPEDPIEESDAPTSIKPVKWYDKMANPEDIKKENKHIFASRHRPYMPKPAGLEHLKGRFDPNWKVSEANFEYYDDSYPVEQAHADLNHTDALPKKLLERWGGKRYTMIVDARLLCDFVYRGRGQWMISKRPGVDFFFQQLFNHYEFVLQVPRIPLVCRYALEDSIDPERCIIAYRVNQTFTYHHSMGKKKNLRLYGRKMSKLVVLDIAKDFVDAPENVMVIPKWDGFSMDTVFLDMIPFFKDLGDKRVPDLRPFISSVELKTREVEANPKRSDHYQRWAPTVDLDDIDPDDTDPVAIEDDYNDDDDTWE